MLAIKIRNEEIEGNKMPFLRWLRLIGSNWPTNKKIICIPLLLFPENKTRFVTLELVSVFVSHKRRKKNTTNISLFSSFTI